MAVREDVEKLLWDIAAALDLSATEYEDAKKRFDALSAHIEDSDLDDADPWLYPQGSFRLGTVIKPFDAEQGYDIDLVCELRDRSIDDQSQKSLKEEVGKVVKDYANQHSMQTPDSKRRCWTLNYAASARFHMDVLPAVSASLKYRLLLEERAVTEDMRKKAISITDEEHKHFRTEPHWSVEDYDWPHSNPNGYAEWFYKQMQAQLYQERMSARAQLVEHQHRQIVLAQVDPVPDFDFKLPLQRAIQLMKRHRDMWIASKGYDPDHKPVSIIITTLVARVYQGEVSLLDTLTNTLAGMMTFIEKRKDEYGRLVDWVENPTDPGENFADKWSDIAKPREAAIKREYFFEWLRDLKQDIAQFFQAQSIGTIEDLLKNRFGESFYRKARGDLPPASPSAQRVAVATSSPNLPAAPHRERPPWYPSIVGSVTITGRIKYRGNWQFFESGSNPLPKGCDLMFQASVNGIEGSFNVFWQVVNTGDEALSVGQKRGKIFAAASAGVGGLRQKEATAYTGTHWIECFIVRNGYLLARSGEYIVNIE